MKTRDFESFGRTTVCPTGHTDAAVKRALDVVLPWLRAQAARLTPERDLREDLIQETCIFLWLQDPTRFDWSDDEDRKYVRRMLSNEMLRIWKEGRN